MNRPARRTRTHRAGGWAGPRGARGFTFIELMMAVTVAGVILALVGPSVRTLLASQRVAQVNAELVTDLQFARSEAVRRNSRVLIEFASTATMSCYVVYLEAGRGGCDCLSPPGRACSGLYEEIKTVQVPRGMEVALAASSGSGATLVYSAQTGSSRPIDFNIAVSSPLRGRLLTSVNATGRPAVCTPDGSIAKVPRCG